MKDLFKKLQDFNRITNEKHFLTFFDDGSGTLNDFMNIEVLYFDNVQECREKMYRHLLIKNSK